MESGPQIIQTLRIQIPSSQLFESASSVEKALIEMLGYTSHSMHRYDLLDCPECGCFYCLAIYSPKEIVEWCDTNPEGIGMTAICPKCGVDAVIGARQGYTIDKAHLGELHKDAFE